MFKDNTNTSNIEKMFYQNGSLIRKKIAEYIPALVMTNLSTLLLISVDGIIVGNFVSKDALSSVNIFYPATLVIGILSALTANGISNSLSTAIGQNDPQTVNKTKAASKLLVSLFAVITSIIQIPIIFFIINSYHLPAETQSLCWQYALGIMIATPFGLLSTVGALQLQIVGKMKVLRNLSLLETFVNLILDLLFVGVLKMGVAGAGFGTMTANIVRATATMVYLIRKTDVYKCGDTKSDIKTAMGMISFGTPEACNAAMLAFRSYFLMKVVLMAFGSDGSVMNGIVSFAFNLANILISSTLGAARPLTGLLVGAHDWKGVKTTLINAAKFLTISVGILIFIIELFPSFFYRLYGVSDIPDGGLTALRISAVYYIFRGYNTLLRLYLTNCKDTKFASLLTIIGYGLLPVFAFCLYNFVSANMLWFCYLITELVLLVPNIIRFKWWEKKQKNEVEPTQKQICLMVKPSEAVEASKTIRNFAKENGCSDKLAYRVALCMEEMLAYSVAVQNNSSINVWITITFTKDNVTFMLFDDGVCTAFDTRSDTDEVTTDNYVLMKKLASSYSYQYVLNMNYSILCFTENRT